MNTLSSYKYQLKTYIKPMIIFFLVITAIDLLNVVVTLLLRTNTDSTVVGLGGEDGISLFFMFVIGISIFSENFYMLLQNGISRKSMYIGMLGSVVSASAICTVLNTVFAMLLELFTLGGSNFAVERSIAETLYMEHYLTLGYAGTILTNMLWLFAFCAAVNIVGLFIAAVMQRLPKYGKFVFWGLLFVVSMVILPIIDTTFCNGAIFEWLVDFVLLATGLRGCNPFAMVITSGVTFAVFAAVIWFLLRRMPAKK